MFGESEKSIECSCGPVRQGKYNNTGRAWIDVETEQSVAEFWCEKGQDK